MSGRDNKAQMFKEGGFDRVWLCWDVLKGGRKGIFNFLCGKSLHVALILLINQIVSQDISLCCFIVQLL
jgi:hypothetical protein